METPAKTNLDRWRWSHPRLVNYGFIRKYTFANELYKIISSIVMVPTEIW